MENVDGAKKYSSQQPPKKKQLNSRQKDEG